MTYSAVVLADSPTLYLKTDEAGTARLEDSANSGHNNYYSVGNKACVNRRVTSPTGFAIEMGISGVSEYNFEGDESALYTAFNNAIATGMTLEFVAKIPNGDTGQSFLVCFGDQVFGNTGFTALFTGGKLKISISSQVAVTDGNVNDGLWHHYVITYDGSTWRCWLDGVLQTATASQTPNTISIARLASFSSMAASCFLGDVSFYPAKLSDARVAAHAAAASGGGSGGSNSGTLAALLS